MVWVQLWDGFMLGVRLGDRVRGWVGLCGNGFAGVVRRCRCIFRVFAVLLGVFCFVAHFGTQAQCAHGVT